MTLAASTSATTYWYLTRGTGVVALLLLTASLVLGILSTLRWRTDRLPRFVVGGLHRNLTLLSIAFIAVHVVTTVLDGYAPIGLKDAVIPFLSSYRPIWLGLGAVAFDLLLALVVTSLLRARVGLRAWRLVHWLAYVSWPVAIGHSLGTGSDARGGWFTLVAFASAAAVAAAIAVRIARASASPARRAAAVVATAAVAVTLFVWYQHGPAQRGWAARAGTPQTILRRKLQGAVTQVSAVRRPLPKVFSGQIVGRIARSSAGNGGIGVAIAANVSGSANGVLRLTLWGWALQSGGLQLTNSTASFQPLGYAKYTGHVIGLAGNRVTVRLENPQGVFIRFTCDLRISEAGYVGGTLVGSRTGGEF